MGEVSSKAASKEAADKKKAKEEKARAKEKSDKKKAKEAADKNAKERRGKNTCTLKAYEHNDYKGRTLSTHHVCSFKLSSGCRQVQLWDEDACKENYKDNVNIQSSVKSVKWDLNDDICGVTVWANRNGWC